MTNRRPPRNARAGARADTPGANDPPPIMWPVAGSGFEADPFSPAGLAQQEWVLASRAGRSRAGRVLVWVIVVLLVLGVATPLLSPLW